MWQGQGQCIRAGISLPCRESPFSSLLRLDGAAGRMEYSGGSQTTSRCSQKDGVRWNLPRGSIPVELTQPCSMRAFGRGRPYRVTLSAGAQRRSLAMLPSAGPLLSWKWGWGEEKP